MHARIRARATCHDFTYAISHKKKEKEKKRERERERARRRTSEKKKSGPSVILPLLLTEIVLEYVNICRYHCFLQILFWD